MVRVLLVVAVVVGCLSLCVGAQSPFSIDGNIRLESSAQKAAKDAAKTSDKKADSWKTLFEEFKAGFEEFKAGFEEFKAGFKDFKAGSCRAQASPMVPSSSWPARGDAALTVCRP